MSRILITGSSGFIGTNLTNYLILRNHKVKCIDIQEPKIVNHFELWENVNILEYKRLESTIKNFNPEYIVHLAARTDLEGGELADYDVNITGVRNLLKISSDLGYLKKILITSSMLVCHASYVPNSQFDYCPTTVYGKSKVETEKITWANQPTCDWALLRPTSIWGPWFSVPYRNFFDMLIRKRYFHIGGRGCTKTYGYVENSCYQIEQILFTDTILEEQKVYYIGDYQPTNIEEWANEIGRELGFKIHKIPFPLMRCGALFGDFLKQIGINFPITSFRLKNMTTNNIVNLESTCKIAPCLPSTRVNGIKNTLDWLSKNR